MKYWRRGILMRLPPAATQRIGIVLVILALLTPLVVGPVERVSAHRSGTLIVTTTADIIHDEDDHENNDEHPECSLREAIKAVNTRSRVNGCNGRSNGEIARISFNIPGNGPHTFQLTAPLPTITAPVIIDGWSEPDFAGTPVIELDGTYAGDSNGLRITSGHSTIRGLVINRFNGSGIRIESKGNNTIQGNYIGTDTTGTQTRSNTQNGIYIANSPNNTIGGVTAAERNIIAGNCEDGIKISGTNATGNVVQGNAIGTNANNDINLGNTRNGVLVQASSNIIGGTAAGAANTIAYNGANGVLITSGNQNAIRANAIFANHALGIDLSANGITANDLNDPDSGANRLQNHPLVVYTVPGASSTTLEGFLNSQPETTFQLDFFANTACTAPDVGQGATFVGSATVTTASSGDASFQFTIPTVLPSGTFVTATATDPQGNTSEFSPCLVAGPGNDTWPRALPLDLTGDPLALTASYEQYLDMPGQSRWYKFTVQPGSSLIVTLDNLTADYDLVLYKDIAQAYSKLASPEDLLRLSTEYANDGFNPDTLSPDALNAQILAPEAFTPAAFDPATFESAVIAPRARSPLVIVPRARSPLIISPRARSPRARSPNELNPGIYDPGSPNPDADAYESAQTRSFLAFSMQDGMTTETIVVNTWNNTGDFYLRVNGRNGIYSLNAPFRVTVTLMPGQCGQIAPVATPSTTVASRGNYRSIILTDLERIEGTAEEKTLLAQKLATFAARPEVVGVVVDVAADQRVAAARVQANTNPACPYAQNVLAATIKDIVESYRSLNELEYVVLVGNDDAIPFFRYPDQSLLGPESDYVPPVLDNTASQASLRLNYLLSQDAYGASIELPGRSSTLPIPELAVGRLVETAADVNIMLDSYLRTTGGVVAPPTSALVTGYDFLADAALAIQKELEAGLNRPVDSLIADANWAFRDQRSWNASQLKQQLLTRRHDLAYLAGHFDANGALAADYATVLDSTEVVASNVDLANAIILSNGCHAGYNIVNHHAIPDVTDPLDWAQAFARKGATLIAGSGYQYGDTEFLEYGERLYLEFSRQLRTGNGPVSVGNALVGAKKAYLATKPTVEEDIDQKTLLIATLFGFPMLSIDMPGTRITPTSDASIVAGTTVASSAPGSTLGLETADVRITPMLTRNTQQLTDTANPANLYIATYLSGSDGEFIRPGEPILPLETRNVRVPNTVLRGVGFRGGSFTDTPDVLPLLGAPTTEIRSVQVAFPTDIFYPSKPWSVNYFDALADPTSGAIQLMVTPAQYRSSTSSSLTGTLREYNTMDFRLFYSGNTQTYGANRPALADAPDISQVAATVNGSTVTFHMTVTGDPSAGIQAVWVTYTATSGDLAGRWQSLDLSRDSQDSRRWTGSLNLANTNPQEIRYMVQAVNGVGLVTLAENLGDYYIPGVDPALSPVGTQPTSLTLDTPPTTGAYGMNAPFSAVLTHAGTPLAGQVVVFQLGAQALQSTTDSNGRATASIALFSLPDDYTIRAFFAGSNDYAASSTPPAQFTITRQMTNLVLTPSSVMVREGDTIPMVATLQDASGRPLGARTVFFILQSDQNTYSISRITDPLGNASLGPVSLPPGNFTLAAYFGGNIPLPERTLNLEDQRYESATATGSLTIKGEPACTLFLNGVPAPQSGESNSWNTPWDPVSGSLTDQLLVQLRNIDAPVSYRWQLTFPTDRSGIPLVEGSGSFTADGDYTIPIAYPPAGNWGTPGADGFGTYESHVTLWISAPCSDQNWDHWYKAPYETDLSVTQTAPQNAEVGDTITYHIEVTNHGPWNAEVFEGRGVRVEDTLPAGVTVQTLHASAGTCQQQGNRIICDLGSLNYLAIATIDIGAKAEQPGTLVNSVSVTPERPRDSNSMNNTATVTTTVTAHDLCYAEGNQFIQNYSPGQRKNGSRVPHPWSDPTKALGMPQGDDSQHYVALGFGGKLIVGFHNVILNNNHRAPDIRIWETSREHRKKPWLSYPEVVRVEVSQDGRHWSVIGRTTGQDQAYDIRLPWVRYIKLTDISKKLLFREDSADGFDVDAIEVLTACSPEP